MLISRGSCILGGIFCSCIYALVPCMGQGTHEGGLGYGLKTLLFLNV